MNDKGYDPAWLIEAGKLLATNCDPAIRAAVEQEVQRQALLGKKYLEDAEAYLKRRSASLAA